MYVKKVLNFNLSSTPITKKNITSKPAVTFFTIYILLKFLTIQLGLKNCAKNAKLAISVKNPLFKTLNNCQSSTSRTKDISSRKIFLKFIIFRSSFRKTCHQCHQNSHKLPISSNIATTWTPL